MLDKEAAQDLAKDLKIDLFTVYREYLQLLFLKYFYAKKGSEKVFFKGGTAIRFLFGSFRFSEDLDFTGLLSPSELSDLVRKTIRKLNREAEGATFKKIESIADSFSGRIFQELPDFGFPLTIRIDISLREKLFNTTSSYIETIFPVGAYPLVTHLEAKEILAEKIRALIIRGRGRDVFDLWFLLTKKIPIDWSLIDKKMSLYRRERKVGLEELIVAVERMSEEEITADLTRFLPLSHRNMVKEMRDLTLRKLEET